MAKLKIIVVGAGHLGTYHARKAVACEDATLLGIVDIDAARRDKLAQSLPYEIETADTLDAFLGRADAAVIATPTVSHCDVASRALKHGMHVLVEKPMTSDSAEALQLLALARHVGRIVQVGHTERFNPAVAAALQLIEQPRYIVAERLGPFTGRSMDVDVVLDLMIHDLDIVAAVVQAELTEVRAIGVPVLSNEVDMASARLQFADGTVAQLSAGRASLEQSRKIRFFTAQRYVSVDCQTREVKSVRRLPADDGSSWPQIVGEPVHVPEGDALQLQMQDFVQAIKLGRAPRVGGSAGLHALRLAEAVKSAMKT